jgi:hypothetical protein
MCGIYNPTTYNWGLGLFKEHRFLAKYKIKTRKSVPDFSRGHNSHDAVVGGFTFKEGHIIPCSGEKEQNNKQ